MAENFGEEEEKTVESGGEAMWRFLSHIGCVEGGEVGYKRGNGLSYAHNNEESGRGELQCLGLWWTVGAFGPPSSCSHSLGPFPLRRGARLDGLYG